MVTIDYLYQVSTIFSLIMSHSHPTNKDTLSNSFLYAVTYIFVNLYNTARKQ